MFKPALVTNLLSKSFLSKSGATLAMLAFALPAFAATEKIELDAFTEVTFTLPFEVEFVNADEHYITLEGDADSIEEIRTRVKGDNLKVYKDNSWFDWNNDNIVVTIGYQTLDAITLAGSGDGFAELLEAEEFTLRITGSSNMEIESMKVDELEISIAGSGNVEVHKLDADKVNSKIAGSGDIELAGRVVSQEISISGSGDHDAGELRSQETTASVRGSGDIRVWAEANLAVSIVGSGDLKYYGEPILKERIVGSGSIVHLGSEP
ncbi:MAG: hypothetical protein ACI9ON_000639 [Limisphaerales bacterium]|jgi:hypothetical protein